MKFLKGSFNLMMVAMFVLSLMLFVPGCSRTQTATPIDENIQQSVVAQNAEDELEIEETRDDDKRIVGVSLLKDETQFHNEIEEGIRIQAEKNGLELIIMNSAESAEEQLSQIQQFITKHVAAIIISPFSSDTIKPVIEQANQANIPVYTININAQADVKCHIETNNKGGGAFAAEYTSSKILDGKGKIAIISYDEIGVYKDREIGIKEVLEQYPDIEIVSIKYASKSDDDFLKPTKETLSEHANLDLIFVLDHSLAVGAFSALNEENTQVKMISFDGGVDAKDKIKKEGVWIADVAQNPKEIGKTALHYVNDLFIGEIVTELKLITPDIINTDSLSRE